MATIFEKIERWKRIRAAVIVLFVALLVFGVLYDLSVTGETTSVCRKITTEQYINEGFTQYKYLITTDDGVFEITSKGMFASPDFGKLEEGREYTFRTRGLSFPFLGVYPYIITAE